MTTFNPARALGTLLDDSLDEAHAAINIARTESSDPKRRPKWTDRVAPGLMVGQLEVLSVDAGQTANGTKARVRCKVTKPDGTTCNREETRNANALYGAAVNKADSRCAQCFRTTQRIKRGAILRRHPDGARKP